MCVCVYTLYKLTFLYMLYTYKIYLFFSGVCLLYLGLGLTIAVSFECIPSGLHFEVEHQTPALTDVGTLGPFF